MQKLTIRYLIISAVFCLLLSCKSYKISDAVEVVTNEKVIQNHYFSNKALDYVYKVHIDIYGKQLGGVFIAKRINDTVHRMVITTDFGNKLLDFEISENSFKKNFIIHNLDKKIIVNTLISDFRTLFQVNNSVLRSFKKKSEIIYQSKNKHYYYFDETSKSLSKVIVSNNRKEKVIFLFHSKNATFAENIQIQHNNIKLKIELNQIIN